MSHFFAPGATVAGCRAFLKSGMVRCMGAPWIYQNGPGLRFPSREDAGAYAGWEVS